jgi:hypothetical protein
MGSRRRGPQKFCREVFCRIAGGGSLGRESRSRQFRNKPEQDLLLNRFSKEPADFEFTGEF